MEREGGRERNDLGHLDCKYTAQQKGMLVGVGRCRLSVL